MKGIISGGIIIGFKGEGGLISRGAYKQQFMVFMTYI